MNFILVPLALPDPTISPDARWQRDVDRQRSAIAAHAIKRQSWFQAASICMTEMDRDRIALSFAHAALRVSLFNNVMKAHDNGVAKREEWNKLVEQSRQDELPPGVSREYFESVMKLGFEAAWHGQDAYVG